MPDERNGKRNGWGGADDGTKEAELLDGKNPAEADPYFGMLRKAKGESELDRSPLSISFGFLLSSEWMRLPPSSTIPPCGDTNECSGSLRRRPPAVRIDSWPSLSVAADSSFRRKGRRRPERIAGSLCLRRTEIPPNCGLMPTNCRPLADDWPIADRVLLRPKMPKSCG